MRDFDLVSDRLGSKPECLPNPRMSALASCGQTAPCALFCHVPPGPNSCTAANSHTRALCRFDSDPRRISSITELGYDAVARGPRGVRTARPQGADIKMPSPSIDHRKWRLCFTTVISATCVIGVGTALAQAPGSVGSRCNVNSDCTSGVCHPVTHLCMISPGAARRPNASCDINSDCGSDGNQPRDKSTPKASGRPVGATCNVNSDCNSRVCHPVTRLCMISPAAARP